MTAHVGASMKVLALVHVDVMAGVSVQRCYGSVGDPLQLEAERHSGTEAVEDSVFGLQMTPSWKSYNILDDALLCLWLVGVSVSVGVSVCVSVCAHVGAEETDQMAEVRLTSETIWALG